MSESVGTIIKVAASIVVASAVVAFVWFAVGENTPDDVTPNAPLQRAQIRNEHLCEAAGWDWTPDGDPPCGDS